MNGFGFIEAVRGQVEHQATPILVFTTESAPELKARASAAGQPLGSSNPSIYQSSSRPSTESQVQEARND